MPFKDPSLHLQHMLAAIEEFLGDIDFATYKENLKTRSAVKRQIFTEAAFRLGDEASIVCPEVDWRARGMGNRLRHWYDKVIDAVVWDAIKIDLPPLKTAVQSALIHLQPSPGGDPA